MGKISELKCNLILPPAKRSAMKTISCLPYEPRSLYVPDTIVAVSPRKQ